MKPVLLGKYDVMKARGRSTTEIPENFPGQKKHIKSVKRSFSHGSSCLVYVSSDQSEQAVNNPLVCKDSLKLKILLFLPVSVLPSLNIGLETAINETKNRSWSNKKMELWNFGKKDGESNWEGSGKTERAWTKIILQDWEKDLK